MIAKFKNKKHYREQTDILSFFKSKVLRNIYLNDKSKNTF